MAPYSFKEEKNVILEVHNKLRRNVAMGGQRVKDKQFMPRSKYMEPKPLEYSDKLAAMAQS